MQKEVHLNKNPLLITHLFCSPLSSWNIHSCFGLLRKFYFLASKAELFSPFHRCYMSIDIRRHPIGDYIFKIFLSHEQAIVIYWLPWQVIDNDPSNYFDIKSNIILDTWDTRNKTRYIPYSSFLAVYRFHNFINSSVIFSACPYSCRHSLWQTELIISIQRPVY